MFLLHYQRGYTISVNCKKSQEASLLLLVRMPGLNPSNETLVIGTLCRKETASGKETGNRSISQGVSEDVCRAAEEMRQHRDAVPGTRRAPATALQMAGSVGADRRRRRTTVPCCLIHSNAPIRVMVERVQYAKVPHSERRIAHIQGLRGHNRQGENRDHGQRGDPTRCVRLLWFPERGFEMPAGAQAIPRRKHGLGEAIVEFEGAQGGRHGPSACTRQGVLTHYLFFN
jgi:hypothetical protein